MAARLPLIAIVGPTASGKTSLSIELAQKFNGEIICADSRTIYRGMDIGTAKPSIAEQTVVPHWGLDLVNPGERFTAADFQQYAKHKIEEIRVRGHVPFLVGGTGLYINSVLYDYNFQNDYDPELRKKFNEKTIQELVNYCLINNINLPNNDKNKRHLIRAIETKNVFRSVNKTLLGNTKVVGITAESQDVLQNRILRRAHEIIDKGVVEESTLLSQKYGWESEAMTGNIYPLVRNLLEGKITRSELIDQFAIADRQLAKRQMTWFKRDVNVQWFSLKEANTYLTNVLSEQ